MSNQKYNGHNGYDHSRGNHYGSSQENGFNKSGGHGGARDTSRFSNNPNMNGGNQSPRGHHETQFSSNIGSVSYQKQNPNSQHNGYKQHSPHKDGNTYNNSPNRDQNSLGSPAKLRLSQHQVSDSMQGLRPPQLQAKYPIKNLPKQNTDAPNEREKKLQQNLLSFLETDNQMDQFIDSSSEEESPQKAEPPKEPEKKIEEKPNSPTKISSTKEQEGKEAKETPKESQSSPAKVMSQQMSQPTIVKRGNAKPGRKYIADSESEASSGKKPNQPDPASQRDVPNIPAQIGGNLNQQANQTQEEVAEKPEGDVKKGEDSDSFSSSQQSSLDPAEKKKFDMEKIKRIQALKQELLRRQKEAKGGMSVADSAKFLAQRGRMEVDKVEQKHQHEKQRQEKMALLMQKKREQKALEKKQPQPKPSQEHKGQGQQASKAKSGSNQNQQRPQQQNQNQQRTQPNSTGRVRESYQSQDYVVGEFACRWNYVLPKYPPENFDYKDVLEQKKLNSVKYEDFQRLKNTPQAKGQVIEETKEIGKSKKSQQMDTASKLPFHLLKAGTTLVYQVAHYPGQFRDNNGKLHDLRPNDDLKDLDPENITITIKPSLATFHKIEFMKLKKLLLKAYTNQLNELEKPDHDVYDAKYEKYILKRDLKMKIEELKRKIQ